MVDVAAANVDPSQAPPHSGLAYPRGMRGPSGIATTFARYRALDLEYAALRVVGRGLFLAVMLMVAFLYVFTRVTDLLAGTNEVLIPTITVTSIEAWKGPWALGLSRRSASPARRPFA